MPNKKKEEKSSLKKFFVSRNTHPKKSLGQNFLRSADVLERIGEIAGISKDDEVLEVGAGLGALTLFLARKTRRVIAVEKDRRLIEELEKRVSGLKNVEIIPKDALCIEFGEFYGGRKIKVVSNLPYSISSQILIKLVEERELFSLLVLMVQREVGERIAASPGSRAYGSISVIVQTYMEVSIELHVPPDAFWPRPKVDSVVIKLTPLQVPRIPMLDEKLFRSIVRAAFSSRRKTLNNSLRSLLSKEQVEKLLKLSGIDGRRRAETLSVEEFGWLSDEALKMKLSP